MVGYKDRPHRHTDALPARALVSFERSKRSHSREGGNPFSKLLETWAQATWIPAFAGITALQKRSQAANDTGTPAR